MHAEAGAPPLAGIAGGHGQMGRWFARFLGACGCDVLVSDLHTPLTNADLAARCAVVVVCVPMRVLPAVLDEVAVAARPGSLVVSTGSVMAVALPALRRTPGEALCVHPLFGPMTNAAGQIAVGAAVRDGPLGRWLLAALSGAGVIVQEMLPDDHDRAMAAVQVMQHACFVAFANALAAGQMDLSAALHVATPTFRLFLALAARILHQHASLYGDIVTLNPHGPAAARALRDALDDVRAAAEAGDAAAFERLFAQARRYFDGAPEDTAALIAAAERILLQSP